MRYLALLFVVVFMVYQLSHDSVVIKDYVPLSDREFVLSEFDKEWPEGDPYFSVQSALDDRVETHVMHVNGKPAGFVIFSMLGKEESEIIYLLLTEPYRGKGYGRKLVSEAISFVKGKGANSTIIQAYHWNIRAQRLYTSLGFKEYERDDKYIRYKLNL